MGGCCCGSSRGAAAQFNSAAPFYYYSSASEERDVPLSSNHAPGSVLQSTGLLVDTNLDTSVPDAYRPPPVPIPFDVAVGRPQTPGRSREARGDKHDGASQTTTASGQENTALITRETLAKCEDALDCKAQINSDPGSEKELENELSKPAVEPPVSATEEEEDCPICLEEYDLENPKLTTKCEHHFHLSCILEWMERSESCPVCDKEMIIDPPID